MSSILKVFGHTIAFIAQTYAITNITSHLGSGFAKTCSAGRLWLFPKQAKPQPGSDAKPDLDEVRKSAINTCKKTVIETLTNFPGALKTSLLWGTFGIVAHGLTTRFLGAPIGFNQAGSYLGNIALSEKPHSLMNKAFTWLKVNP